MGGIDLPARLGKYELQEYLGGGGMSLVYRARDLVIGRTVAVKILTDAACADPAAKTRFLAEARMAGNLSHDNILGIYDFGQDEHQRPFMVMEYLQGEDLAHAIQNGHTGDLRERLKVALQVARALHYIHERKIVHRDIKPENIHLNPNGVVKLMDFGIAKAENLSMTRAGYVLGTPSYMSPEQVRGQPVTEQVDVYSFGLVLFELLTGTKGFSGDTMERLFYSILNEPVNLTPLAQANVPPAIYDLVKRSIAKNPEERPRGFGEIAAALEAAVGALDQAAAPAPVASRRWMGWLGGAALAVVVLLAVAWYFFGPGSGRLPRILDTTTGQMVLVAAGEFQFGENKEHLDLPAFYIDKTEVTNEAYGRFCKETKRQLPDGFLPGKPELPVVNVTILNARDYARWAGKRLPSGREWEKAGRGPDGRKFPWGNQADASRANVGRGQLQPANSLPDGASPYRALNMAGNVWELVEELSSPGPKALEYFRVALRPPPGPDEPWYTIRGQSFRQGKLAEGVLWDAATVPARWKAVDIGFRCVKDAH